MRQSGNVTKSCKRVLATPTAVAEVFARCCAGGTTSRCDTFSHATVNFQPTATADGRNYVIRILFVEDLEYEMELALSQLKRAGIECVSRRVETEAALLAALQDFAPTLVLSDFSLPQFDGLSALAVVREHAPDVPFLFLSGTIGEERAIEALRRGAVDYVLKTNMARLAPAVRRAVEDAAARVDRRRQEAQIARLNRIVKMVSGVNGLIVRIRDRAELLREACRLAVSVGGYTAAVASSKMPGIVGIMPVAWAGTDEALTESLRAQIAESTARDTSIIGRVLKSGEVFVCNNTQNLNATASFNSMMISAGLCSLVALPLSMRSTRVSRTICASCWRFSARTAASSIARITAGASRARLDFRT